jgi:hypothetical protein
VRDDEQKAIVNLTIPLGQYWIAFRQTPDGKELPILTPPPDQQRCLLWFSRREKALHFIERGKGGPDWFAGRLPPGEFLQFLRQQMLDGNARYVICDYDPDAAGGLRMEIFRFLAELEGYVMEKRKSVARS